MKEKNGKEVEQIEGMGKQFGWRGKEINVGKG